MTEPRRFTAEEMREQADRVGFAYEWSYAFKLSDRQAFAAMLRQSASDLAQRPVRQTTREDIDRLKFIRVRYRVWEPCAIAIEHALADLSALALKEE